METTTSYQQREPAPGSRPTARWLTLGGGWALLAVGLVLLVLPGPGLAFILGGLALLGREVAWARRLRHRIDEKLARKLRRTALRSP